VVFLESHARLLLVLHAIVGATTVATTTHLTVWAWRSLRDAPRLAGLRWLGTACLSLFATQFALGNLLYPSYKVHVRAEYLELPSAQAADARARRDAHDEVLERAGRAPDPPPESEPPRLARIARLFDVKEHAVALALPIVAAACALAWTWRPERDGPRNGRLLLACAAAAALVSWLAAIVGLVTTSVRSVG